MHKLRRRLGGNPPRIVDAAVEPGHTYHYHLEAIDLAGNSEFCGPIDAMYWGPMDATVDWGKQGIVLRQNRQNPLVPTASAPSSTTISFEVTNPGPVELTLYDTSGYEVRRLVEEWRDSGHHVTLWDGRDTRSRALGSGVCFHRLETDLETVAGWLTRKLQLIR